MPHVIYPGPNVAEEVGKGPTLHREAGTLVPGRNFVRSEALAERLIDSGLCARDPEAPVPGELVVAVTREADGARFEGPVGGPLERVPADPAAEKKTETPAPAGENEPRAKRGGR